MGLDIYKQKIRDLPENCTLEDVKDDVDGSYYYIRLDIAEEFEKPLIEFIKKTGKYKLFSEKVCELGDEINAYLKQQNITIDDIENWSYMGISHQDIQKLIESYEGVHKKGKKYVYLANLKTALPFVRADKHYIQFSYSNAADLKDALNFIRYCQHQHVLGEIVIQDCQQYGMFNGQDKFLIVEYLLAPKDVENIVWRVEKTGYQRKGFKDDLSFFRKYYGSCWYVIENNETEAIEIQMVYLMDNKLLQEVKKTFEDDTPIQHWHLAKDEYVRFSA